MKKYSRVTTAKQQQAYTSFYHVTFQSAQTRH